MGKLIQTVAVIAAALSVARWCQGQEASPPTAARPSMKQDYLDLATRTEQVLRLHVLDVWFPRCVDTQHGGFHANFARDWKPVSDTQDGKFSVFQARMTWIASEVAIRRPEVRDRFLPIARHGVAYLRDVLWDQQHGGFFWGLSDDGRISAKYTDGKHLYGNAFCLYAMAAAHRATGDPDALELARRAFRWIDEHAHDPTHRGYHEWLTRSGQIVRQEDADASLPRQVPVAGFPVGHKSMNTHIHLLEAFTQLYQVWKDPVLGARLQELIAIVRDRICVEQGALHLYFTEDWRPTSDRDSYGHDVETAFLLLEAEHALGERADSGKTRQVAKRLVDHALAVGWDRTHGGFYREGPMLGQADDLAKDWWVQFEGLNALLLMHELHGQQTGAYFDAFLKQWRFIHEHMIDHEHGGVYESVAADGTVIKPVKAQIWKAAYHDGRALLNVSDRLRAID
ncbi:AGE family epimerase/isomerase [Fontivita pretiosa]|uniref:AGE family epimerase/isomerase n=1 Tax=Fontivita pretiosa TaxID=2989684 RepID=UPI003D16F43C